MEESPGPPAMMLVKALDCVFPSEFSGSYLTACVLWTPPHQLPASSTGWHGNSELVRTGVCVYNTCVHPCALVLLPGSPGLSASPININSI